MDSDAVVLRDPLLPFNTPFDVQGLSDWADDTHPIMSRGHTLNSPCQLYLLKEDVLYPSKSGWTEIWKLNPNEVAMLAPNPCQSTGLWYLQPTAPAVDFMRALMERIAFHIVQEWDQTAWNDVITHFLWGAGNDEPVRYRLLPFSEFANVGTYRARKEYGLEDNPIVLHLGGVNGGENKRDTWIAEGYWVANFTWDRHAHPTSAGGRVNVSTAAIAVPLFGSGWWLFWNVSVGLIGGVYYWRRKNTPSQHRVVLSV